MINQPIHKKFLEYWQLLEQNTIKADLGMGMPKPEFFSQDLIATKYFEKGLFYRPDYQHQAGDLSLRKLLAKFQVKHTKLSYSFENIMLVDGALGGFSLTMSVLASLLNNFTIIEIVPTYPLLSGEVRFLAEQYNAKIITITPRDTLNFTLAEEEITSKIKPNSIIYLTNPNNPTGKYIPSDIMEALVNTCEKTDSYLVVDECCDIPFKSTYSYKWVKSARVIRIQSFSKQYLLAGFRIGYIVASPEFIKLFSTRFCFAEGNAPVVVNDAITYFIKNEKILSQVSNISQHCVENVIKQLQKSSLVENIVQPEACYYLFLKVKNKLGSWKLFEKLVKNGIDIVPGTLFGISENESWIRICCAKPKKELKESLETLLNIIST